MRRRKKKIIRVLSRYLVLVRSYTPFVIDEDERKRRNKSRWSDCFIICIDSHSPLFVFPANDFLLDLVVSMHHHHHHHRTHQSLARFNVSLCMWTKNRYFLRFRFIVTIHFKEIYSGQHALMCWTRRESISSYLIRRWRRKRISQSYA